VAEADRGLAPLTRALAARKDAIVAGWLSRTLESYPERNRRFLLQERDAFRNPAGHAFREALPALLDELLGAMDCARIEALLDGIVRIRAVQDFTAGQAVAFVFLLKKVIRDELRRPAHTAFFPSGGEDKGEGCFRLKCFSIGIKILQVLKGIRKLCIQKRKRDYQMWT